VLRKQIMTEAISPITMVNLSSKVFSCVYYLFYKMREVLPTQYNLWPYTLLTCQPIVMFTEIIRKMSHIIRNILFVSAG